MRRPTIPHRTAPANDDGLNSVASEWNFLKSVFVKLVAMIRDETHIAYTILDIRLIQEQDMSIHTNKISASRWLLQMITSDDDFNDI